MSKADALFWSKAETKTDLTLYGPGKLSADKDADGVYGPYVVMVKVRAADGQIVGVDLMADYHVHDVARGGALCVRRVENREKYPNWPLPEKP